MMKKVLTSGKRLLTEGWLLGVLALVVLAVVGMPPTWASAQSATSTAFTSLLPPPDGGDHEEMDELMAKLDELVDRDALLAEILGISEEELAAARETGTRLDELVESLGWDQETVRTSLHSAIDAAVAQAVTDGLLTEAEADILLNPPTTHGPGDPGRGPAPEGTAPANGGPGGPHHEPPVEETTEDGDATDTTSSATTTDSTATPTANRPARGGRAGR